MRDSCRRLILFELNEVPWQVLDSYVEKCPNGATAELVANSKLFTTVCEDELRLDPWIAWPTLHRGVTDNSHGILHLGQDLDYVDSEYAPIWSLLVEAGVRVGVFGSLHSNRVPENIDDYCFFVPDTFADHDVVKPENLAPLQQFNLIMTRKSARNVNTSIPVKEAIRFLKTYATRGASLDTAALVGTHLVSERLHRHLRCRRRSLQPAIMFDVFLQLMRTSKPDFATFFTNHVAAAMHRFWAARFPSDVAGNMMPEQWTQKFQGEIDNAMAVFDRMLKRLIKFIHASPEYRLVIATAIGQTAVRAYEASGFVSIADMERFLDCLGLPRQAWSEKHAMVPSKSVLVSEEYVDMLEEKLMSIKINGVSMRNAKTNRKPLGFDRRSDNSFHILVYMENYDGPSVAQLGNETLSFDEIGLANIPHQDSVACTARHTPVGSMLIYDPQRPQGSHGRPMISTLELAPAILDAFDITPPPYMRRPDPTLLDVSIDAPFRLYEVSSPERQRQLQRVT